MSNEIKLSLLALVVLPLFAVWFFWGRPANDAATESPPARLELARDTAPATFVAPATRPVALSESAPEPAPSSSAAADLEARRLLLRRRPSFLHGTPAGCDPPYLIDGSGNKRYKKECF